MSLVATVRAMVAAGATPEVILAVVEAHEAARDDALTQRRTADAARQQAARDRRNNVTSRDVRVTPRTSRDSSPHAGAGAQVVNPSLPSLRSEEVVGGGVGVTGERVPVPDDWPSGKAREHAAILVETVASPWLDPSKSPDLVTTAGRLSAWKLAGASWEFDVLAVVSGLTANRRSRIASWKFFDDAIARSIADNRQALEIPEAGAVRATGPPRLSLTQQIGAENAEAKRRAFALMDAQNGR